MIFFSSPIHRYADMTIPTLRLIGNLMVASQRSEYDFCSFGDQLACLQVNFKLIDRFLTDGKPISQSIVDLFETENDVENNEIYAIDVMYKIIVQLIDFDQDNDDGDKISTYACRTMGILLKFSSRTRHLATAEQLVLHIIDEMNIVNDALTKIKHTNNKVKKKSSIFRCFLCFLFRISIVLMILNESTHLLHLKNEINSLLFVCRLKNISSNWNYCIR